MLRFFFALASFSICQGQYAQQVLTFQNQVNLVPEGIAIHPGNNTIFISSIAKKKIIKLKTDGTSSDFILEEEDGYLEGLGMKVDVKKNCLWALSNIRTGKQFTSRIHAFNLEDGKMTHKFNITDTIPTLFNDLLIDSLGNLLITDTYYSSVYRYDPTSKQLQILFKDTSKLKWPNGIASLNHNNLVVATYGKGIVRIDLSSKSVIPLTGYTDENIAFGLDGIVVSGNYMYGVFNAGRGGYGTNAVIRYMLNADKTKILSEEIIDKGNVAFADPTTAAIFKDQLCVIANSHLDQFNANKEKVAGIESQLTPLKLVMYKVQ